VNTFLESLKDRAKCLSIAREFFAERNILEVDTPILSSTAPVDEHIDVFRVMLPDNKCGYLHTSPEYAMKRLIAQGIGDIFQLGHVFREGEIGDRHNPEFTMAEWYRMGMPYETFIEETLDFIRCFLGDLPSEYISYREAFRTYVGIDYLYATQRDLLAAAKNHNVTLSEDAESWDRSTLLHLLLSFVVEPHLGKDKLTVLLDYPASEAALAKLKQKDDEPIAERFEIYYQSVELANGYHELTDSEEQLKRFEEANRFRIANGKLALPIDFKFLEAMKKMPDCCGVAVGFDRLMLLRRKANSLATVLPFVWSSI
jgi:lysyl-tRNA synthetase class 2